jgi:hypothetical protein
MNSKRNKSRSKENSDSSRKKKNSEGNKSNRLTPQQVEVMLAVVNR